MILPFPQRSRRLSASGMGTPRLDTPLQSVPSKKQTPFSVWYNLSGKCDRCGSTSLKEADAFQRLVCFGNSNGMDEGCDPQRSRRLSASGMVQIPYPLRASCLPSKKQTPFSVWYSAALSSGGAVIFMPSKKQTPFSVWYQTTRSPGLPRFRRLKEADAFQRLVFPALPRHSRESGNRLKEADAFQRLVSGGATTADAYKSRLKEADAFQRLVFGEIAQLRRYASRLKEADAFQRLV